MFRKLGERLASAASSVLGTDDASKVSHLTAMGFDAESATRALEATNGDMDRAAELLLIQGSVSSASNTTTSSFPQHQQQAIDLTMSHGDEDEMMQRALQLSVEDEEQRRRRTVSAASRKAGEAALARATATTVSRSKSPKTSSSSNKSNTTTAVINNNTKAPPPARPTSGLETHHPDVKIIPKLQDKSKEEQVIRCADRLKSSPQAVDTLHRALTTIQSNPNDSKFRTIDKTTGGYKRSLEDVPGAEDLLLAMNFRKNGNTHLVLERSLVDPALLYLGISALEQTKLTDEYIQGKRRAAFNKELQQILASADASEAEAIRRSEFLSKCPSEPVNGRGALLQVIMADQSTIRRRFDGDDTLGDVLHWLGAHGSVIPERLVSREWSLVDLNHFPVAPLDCAANGHHTLQYLGCWPSGKLELQPSTEEWKQGLAKSARTTSRGLGSAPAEVI